MTTVLPVTPEGVGAPIETVDDAIAEDARLAAVIDVATERRQALKVWTLATLRRPGASVELEGVGKALVTDPSTVPNVTDDDAWRAWALRYHPDRTDTFDTIDPDKIAGALRGELDDAGPVDRRLSVRLAEILDEIPGAVVTQVAVDGKLAADVSKPKAARELDDGRLVDKSSGEIIPGLELRVASSPAPRLTPDKALVSTLADEIRGRLAPVPTLETSD